MMDARHWLSSLARRVDPWLALALAVGGWVRFGRIGDFDNQYYTATVASMLQSLHNFLYASFDPGGMVMVDKPPGAFWVQAILPAIFGVSRWAVNLPQALAGTLSMLILYLIIRRTFGWVAGAAAALALMALPASIVIDSRNEPDGILMFTLLLVALCIMKAARSGWWPWLLAFALLMAFAFNIKMLVAFVPLPAFLLYYLLAARLPARRLALSVIATGALLLIFSFSWASAVALTPTGSRPYIGSTRDNSIWTLVFKYNGLDRFTSFIGPRPQQLQPGAALPPGAPGYLPQQVAPASAAAPDQGVLGLFTNPLAAQLGWLLPLGVLALMASLALLLSQRVLRRPLAFLSEARESPAIAETILWTGWLGTAGLAFGLANATTTHPYYLVGMALPLAATLGIGFAALWRAFREGAAIAWILPLALAGGLAYQMYLSRGQVGDLMVAAATVVMLLALITVSVALWRKLGDSPLAVGAAAMGGLSLLIIPLIFGLSFGGQIAGPGPGSGLQRPPQAPRLNPEQGRVLDISSYIEREGDAGSVFVVGAVNAREAAPFIIAGVSALAIGGFSGGDPVFTVASFREMVERGELRYFLMPTPGGTGGAGGPGGQPQQGPILSYIRNNWQDVSRAAGLPPGSLYRYRGP
ncbi:MAG: glycosyltransferase family 39 protein [Chloroflexi bacterium]|nr:glycosyltransferase family 39 protein [Chloroflexota bacterium]